MMTTLRETSTTKQNENRKHERNAIQAKSRARQSAYLSQPVYLEKKIEWSGVRLLSLSGSYYPPNGDYAGAPNQS
jgi:hypothetical protein